MVAAARASHVVLMEAFMYRRHPQTAKFVEIVRTGELGRAGARQDRRVRLHSTRDWVHVPSPWVVNREGAAPVDLAVSRGSRMAR